MPPALCTGMKMTGVVNGKKERQTRNEGLIRNGPELEIIQFPLSAKSRASYPWLSRYFSGFTSHGYSICWGIPDPGRVK